MSGHAIRIRLMEDGYAETPELVCMEPPGIECRLSCPNRCDMVAVCGRGTSQCDADEHVDALHCANCGAPFLSLSAEDCHIVTWIDNWEDHYGGGNVDVIIPVEIEWEAQGATWSLPDNLIAVGET